MLTGVIIGARAVDRAQGVPLLSRHALSWERVDSVSYLVSYVDMGYYGRGWIAVCWLISYLVMLMTIC